MELFADIIKPLALKKQHRIGPVEGRLQQSFGIVGSSGEHDLQTGHMRGKGGPVLRMLGSIQRAHGDAQHHGYVQLSRAHGLPFGHLVENFVPGPAHKVAVHELDHAAASAHAVTYGGGYDCRLGNGRVKQAVIRDGFVHALIGTEGAAPIPHILSVDNEGRVRIQFVHDRFKDCVPVGVNPAGGHRRAVRAKGEAFFPGNFLHPAVLLLRSEHIAGTVIQLFFLFIGKEVSGDSIRLLIKVHTG
ncbi:hypothetical protein SDC9_146616 [bioreactor metagenome]|uniref:Uncharacterized protein n=1 Tax=bioreactor metagenome TaxID=1076179 RepID=A0A645ED52_9ZZZZ